MNGSLDDDRIDSSDAEIEALQQLCDRLAGFGAELDIEWLDGFIAALLCGPRTVMPSEWIPVAFGDAFERAHGDPEDLQRATDTLMARWNVVAQQLLPERLAEDETRLWYLPIVLPWDDEARAKLVAEGLATEQEAQALQTGHDWALGFLHAVQHFEADWAGVGMNRSEREMLDTALSDIALLALAPGSERYERLLRDRDAPPNLPREELIDNASFAVQDLRLLWLERNARPAPRRVDAQPGRNDPCPCGSGIKYKKCHGG